MDDTHCLNSLFFTFKFAKQIYRLIKIERELIDPRVFKFFFHQTRAPNNEWIVRIEHCIVNKQ